MEKMKKFKEWAPKVFGEMKTEKIVALSEKRESIIENYGEMYFKLCEFNKNLSDIDYWLKERYGVGKYNQTDRPEELKKELDKKVMAKVCRIAAGKLWSDTCSDGAERWTAGIRESYFEKHCAAKSRKETWNPLNLRHRHYHHLYPKGAYLCRYREDSDMRHIRYCWQ